MQPFPNVTQFFVNRLGTILQPWMGYLQQFTIPPPPFMPIDVGASPFEYEAKEPGNLAISDGTVTLISITRGSDTITLGAGTDRFIPVAINDIVTITYSVLPTIKFVPSYGQNTTN